jgi:general secretion pathway protein D
VSFDPPTVSAQVGATFTVNIDVSGAQNAFSIPLQINYDPKVLQIVDVSNGGFLNQDGQTPALVFRADTAKGMLQVTATRPPKSPGVSGSGQLFVLTLNAKAAGETVLDISGASILDTNMQATAATGGDLLVRVTGESSTPENKAAAPAVPPKMEPEQPRRGRAGGETK